MERIFRVRQDGETFFAIERGGELLRATGDPFSCLISRRPGSRRPRRGDGARAGAAVENRVRRPQLQGSRGGSRQGPAGRAAAVHQASTSVIGPGEPIRLPPGVGRVDHEAELGVVIGRRAHRVPRGRAWDYVLGLICVNDVTARDLQKKEAQYTRCKGFDTFAPIGPCIATGLGRRPRDGRRTGSTASGARRRAPQHLIFPIDHLMEYITFVMTLEPGDIISTGTPEGIGPLDARRCGRRQGRRRRRADNPVVKTR